MPSSRPACASYALTQAVSLYDKSAHVLSCNDKIEPFPPNLSFLQPKYTRRIPRRVNADAHIIQGSTVTYKSHPSRTFALQALETYALSNATISACRVALHVIFVLLSHVVLNSTCVSSYALDKFSSNVMALQRTLSSSLKKKEKEAKERKGKERNEINYE